jgi:hypothetical protein
VPLTPGPLSQRERGVKVGVVVLNADATAKQAAWLQPGTWALWRHHRHTTCRRLVNHKRANQGACMKTYEFRIELTDRIIQELLWQALTPDDSIVMMPFLNDALEQQYAQIGPPPTGAQISGISVSIREDGVYAEITYTQVAHERGAE